MPSSRWRVSGIAAIAVAIAAVVAFGLPVAPLNPSTGAEAASDNLLTKDEARELARHTARGFIDRTRASESAAPERPPQATIDGHPIGIGDLDEVEAQFIPEEGAGPAGSAVTGSQYTDLDEAAWLFVFAVEGLVIPEWDTEEGLYEVEVVISAETGQVLRAGVGLYPLPHENWVPSKCPEECYLRD
ncbi:MAG: hypothetical protein IT303_16935 [Dehalococcoidia bacterium]|nr:hypothetical protein [Dehalococcoidia bacterium]